VGGKRAAPLRVARQLCRVHRPAAASRQNYGEGAAACSFRLPSHTDVYLAVLQLPESGFESPVTGVMEYVSTRFLKEVVTESPRGYKGYKIVDLSLLNLHKCTEAQKEDRSQDACMQYCRSPGEEIPQSKPTILVISGAGPCTWWPLDPRFPDAQAASLCHLRLFRVDALPAGRGHGAGRLRHTGEERGPLQAEAHHRWSECLCTGL
jgi:hypothetical protein